MTRPARSLFSRSVGAVATALAAVAFSPIAVAGCGSVDSPAAASPAPARPAAPDGGFRMMPAGHFVQVSDREYSNLPIVGLWKFTQSLPGNGGVFDSGFTAWHTDRTEIMNSSKAPLTGSFCLGVWKALGNASYRLNHYALSSSADGSTLIGIANIKEDVTLDSTGDAFSGTWSLNQMDMAGNTVFSAAGTVVATRVTVD